MQKNPWWLIPRPVARPRVRLMCLPYAGGSAAIYQPWAAALPADVELWVAQLPGRGRRFGEPCAERIDQLLDGLAPALATSECAYALFGHSMGAALAFELARRARRDGAPAAAYLLVSGLRAPGCAPREEIHALPDDAFVAELRKLGGMRDEVLREPELLSVLLPMLRADLRLVATWKSAREPPLSMPIAAFGGLSDAAVPVADLESWREHTLAGFSVHLFPGGHFFLHEAREALIALLSRYCLQ